MKLTRSSQTALLPSNRQTRGAVTGRWAQWPTPPTRVPARTQRHASASTLVGPSQEAFRSHHPPRLSPTPSHAKPNRAGEATPLYLLPAATGSGATRHVRSHRTESSEAPNLVFLPLSGAGAPHGFHT